MKTFNRTSLPEKIKYNGVYYMPHTTVNAVKCQGSLSNYLMKKKIEGIKVIQCAVLSRNLKGKTDYHGQPYKPSIWLFVSE